VPGWEGDESSESVAMSISQGVRLHWSVPPLAECAWPTRCANYAPEDGGVAASRGRLRRL